MFEIGQTTEYRIGVFGPSRAGKTVMIHKLCNYFEDNPESTMNESQYTMIMDNSFVYFWDFPPHILTSNSAADLLIGFGGLMFVFDLNKDISSARSYLEKVMTIPSIQRIPLLLVGTKIDLIPPEEIQNFQPSMIMDKITSNIRKTQCIFFSVKTGQGEKEIIEWIQKRPRSVDRSENLSDNSTACSSVFSSQLL